MKKLIPVDPVDAKGNVWKTTGENIRNGAKEFSEDDIKSIVDIMFPIGSVYCGENSFVLSVGTWNRIEENVGEPIFLARLVTSGANTQRPTVQTSDVIRDYTALRMYKRVS